MHDQIGVAWRVPVARHHTDLRTLVAEEVLEKELPAGVMDPDRSDRSPGERVVDDQVRTGVVVAPPADRVGPAERGEDQERGQGSGRPPAPRVREPGAGEPAHAVPGEQGARDGDQAQVLIGLVDGDVAARADAPELQVAEDRDEPQQGDGDDSRRGGQAEDRARQDEVEEEAEAGEAGQVEAEHRARVVGQAGDAHRGQRGEGWRHLVPLPERIAGHPQVRGGLGRER